MPINFRRILRRFRRGLERTLSSPGLPAAARALQWLRDNELSTGGIRVHSRHDCAYPEVTGYLVPTLLAGGERELSRRLVRWLVAVQRSGGAYTDSRGDREYVFDTAQALRGLLAGIELASEARGAAGRAADWLCGQMLDEGRGGFGPRYKGDVPETVHLYVLPPLMEAAGKLDAPRCADAARRCLDHYLAHPEFLRVADLTHFLAYQLEALIDLGRADLALPVLNALGEQQLADGAVRGKGGVAWVCAPGLAQLAICWYKAGRPEPADKALAWLEARQEPSGGFLGSYGRGAAYFPEEEISWAAKFFLDAHLLRTAALRERNARVFPAEVAPDDGRVGALLALVKPGDCVLEAGCGKGRFLKAVRDRFPDCRCSGLDISPELLGAVPGGIAAVRGALENIPWPDDSFDVVFSVEALEHSVNPAAAVAEMIRVARPGGWVAIIDKQLAHWGRMQCPPWERWPDADRLRRTLSRGCDQVSVEPVGCNDRPAADGLMMIWRGRKRSALTGEEWHRALLTPAAKERIVADVRANRLIPWAPAVLLATEPGESVLEVGSGTGQISMHLTAAGRRVTLLDCSAQSLDFARECAAALGVEVETVLADATRALPFADGRFGCVWSSGLLEHFSAGERRGMLREFARVASRRVIALVPNAGCLAYRAGKALQEAAGQWRFGLETPLRSLRPDFEAAGLMVLEEFSVGAGHALNFLPEPHPLRQALADWLAEAGPELAEAAGQGYLLCTVGAPRGGGGAGTC